MCGMLRVMKRLRDAREGGVLMLVGLGMMVMVAAGGAAVDIGRQQLVRAKLQQATDAAGIAYAAADKETDAEREKIAQRYYELNYPVTYLGIARPAMAVTVEGDVVKLTTENKQMPTNFMWAAGIDTLDINVRSVVNVGASSVAQPYDLVLVVDNSGSMANADVGSGDTLDSSNPAASVRNAGIAACTADEAAYGAALGDWNCPGTVDGPNVYDVNTGKISTYGFGIAGETRLNAARFSTNTIASQLLNPPNAAGSQVGVVTWSMGLITPTQPLTTDLSAVQNALDRMYANGATNSTSGLAAAQTMLAATPPTPGRVRAVVLLTDGANTTIGVPLHSDLSSLITKVRDNALCTLTDNDAPPQVCGATNVASNAVCTALKNSGVLVYTIAFGKDVVTGSLSVPAQKFLRDCASDAPGGLPKEGNTFFTAPDAATLKATFGNIVKTLRKVRITG